MTKARTIANATVPAATPTTQGGLYGLTQVSSVDPANIGLGQEIYETLTTGTWNLALGHGSMYGITSGDDNIAIGAYTLYENGGGEYNTVVGQYSAWDGLTLAPGFNNTIIGANSGGKMIRGDYNVALGAEAGNYVYGDRNIAIGPEAMDQATGSGNIGIGWYTYWNGGTIDDSIAIGSQALMGDNGGNNIAIGAGAMYNKRNGKFNVALGSFANSLTQYSWQDSLGYNVFIGAYSGTQSAGQDNVILGYAATGADPTPGGRAASTILTSGSNNIIVGALASPSSPTVSNEITLGNTAITKFRIPGLGFQIDSNVASLGKPLIETATVSGTSLSSGVTYDLLTNGAVTLYTSTMGNWGIYLRGSSTVTIDSILSVGQSLTFAVLATNSLTGYYHTSLYVDNTLRTVKWQGGSAPTSGNTNSIDAYTFTLIKTAANTYTILGSVTKFA